MIRIKNLTKDFGNRKGVFGLDFEVEDGEVFGFMGPAGSGKTTTVRQMLGFASSSSGHCVINKKNSYRQAAEIQSFLGYLPGEAALPKEMTGISFIRLIANMRGLRNLERAFELIERFEVEKDEKIYRMTKEGRKKIGIICAFMHNPQTLILDEPTVWLEPVMQERFIELILEEKERGKTMFITSQVFEEIERTCDRVGMIWEGSLVNIDDIEGIRSKQRRNYIIKFDDQNEVFRFMTESFDVIQIKEKQIIVNVKGEMMSLIHALNNYKVTSLETTVQSLEEIFPHYYGGQLHA